MENIFCGKQFLGGFFGGGGKQFLWKICSVEKIFCGKHILWKTVFVGEKGFYEKQFWGKIFSVKKWKKKKVFVEKMFFRKFL